MKEDTGGAVQAENRRLAAIMFTDIVGFSRQMGSNEVRTLRLLDVHNQTIQQAVTEHHGKVIKTIGDAFLVDFPSVVHAVQCAQQIHAQFRAHNTEKEQHEQIHIRVGIHLGDIVQKDGDVFGDGVNIASRLQGLAEPDTICLSHVVYQEVAKKLALGTVVSLGRPKLKNIAERFRVYALLSEPPKGLRQTLRVQRLKLSRRVGTVVFVLVSVSVLLLGGIVILLYPSLSPLITHHASRITQEAQPPLLPLPDKPSIVVLPFVNLSKDPEQDYFSDGLTEVLTGDLTRLSGLFVIARNSAFTYKGKAVKVQDVGREMGVRYVLEGSVLKSGDKLRINAQLIDATTGYHLWSERYDRPLKDIFALQDEIVQKIVTTLKLQLSLREQGILVRKTTDNLEAYDYLLRGLESYFRFTKEANVQARQMFEKAIELDPQYALAYAILSATYSLEWNMQWSTDPQTLERAGELAQKALALDGSLPLAHSVLSWVYVQKQQPDQAIAESEQAIALDPNAAGSYAQLADVLNTVGRPEEAVRFVEQAMRLNPRYPVTYLVTLGLAYRLTGRHAEAITAFKQVIGRNPNFVGAHTGVAGTSCLWWGFQFTDDPQTLAQALAAAQRAVALNDSAAWTHLALSYVYLWQKQYEKALAEAERAIAVDPTYWKSGAYAALADRLSRAGRAEEALKVVEQALHLGLSLGAPTDWYFYHLGSASYLSGRSEEAIALLQQLLSQYPKHLGGHLTLAAVYSELGREAEARAEAAEVLRLNPKFSLEVHSQRVPIKDPAVLERHLAALRKAGLR
jgi:adenylate cyclase